MNKLDYCTVLGEVGSIFSVDSVFTRLVIDKFGHFDKCVFACLDDMATREWLERRRIAKDEAMQILRTNNRGIKHQDLLDCMEVAILTRVAALESNPNIETALMLAASIVCKNILMDGPLHQ